MDRHAVSRRLRHLAGMAGVRLPRMHPLMLRHTFVTTMLPASTCETCRSRTGTPTPTTMRYDRACENLDRPPNCILAAYLVSGT